MTAFTPTAIPLDLRHPFSKAQAIAAGISRHQLRGPRFQRVIYDRYVDASIPVTTRLRAIAALQVSLAGAFVSHWTAAELWGGARRGSTSADFFAHMRKEAA